jgi:hypothetical protein
VRNRLYLCNTTDGNVELIDSKPRLDFYEEVLYLPAVDGLYDRGGRLIIGSACLQWPGPRLVNASIGCPLPGGFAAASRPDLKGPFLFVGHLRPHYGHFLLSTFSRLWPYNEKLRMMRLLTRDSAEQSFTQHPYMTDLFGALGMNSSDFVRLDKPTILKEVFIPHPAFEEGNFVHKDFSVLCRGVAKKIVVNNPSTLSSKPIYLSKLGLNRGISGCTNEEDFAEELERLGVEIVLPERLSLAEQIARISASECVTGIIGSALHSAIFVEPKNMVVMAYSDRVSANQLLIDRISGHLSTYVYPAIAPRQIPSERFLSGFKLSDPKGLAADFLRFMELRSKPRGTVGGNLAFGKPVNQSSVSERSLALSPEENARGAVSGFYTGSFQFHTGLDNNPWWEVDLQELHDISEIRIFNRIDSGSERASHIAVLTAAAEGEWQEIFRRIDDEPFGGIDGNHLSIRPASPVRARYVRIIVLAISFLHLDQVEIFGAQSER